MENGAGFLGFITPELIWDILSASGIAAWISAVLNSKSDNKVAQFILDLLNLIGGNVFKGKNADSV